MEIESHLGHPYLQSINIWYPTDQNARNFLVKFLANFKTKCVEISIIYECNFKIVKICQKCANFESGLLSEKLLRIEKVAQNRTSCEKSNEQNLSRPRIKFNWNFVFLSVVFYTYRQYSIALIPHTWVSCFIFHDSVQDCSSIGPPYINIWLKISMPGSANEISQNNR